MSKSLRTKTKMPPEMNDETKEMLKAGVVMSEREGVAHVKRQAGHIFDKYHEPIEVAKLRLKEEQEELSRLIKELHELRQARRKIPDITPDIQPNPEKQQEGPNDG